VFIRLDDVAAADLSRIGGKAFNCARLRQAGFPVPDGVVVSSDTTDAGSVEAEVVVLRDPGALRS